MFAFEFATAQRIKFGPGCIRQLGGLVAGYGRRAALLTGGNSLRASGRLGEIEAQLREAGIAWQHTPLAPGEPTVEQIDALASTLREFAPEALIAIGGGSVLDAGKAVAALLANGGSALDYLEGVGRGATLSKPSLPCIAIPTTAGTGSEVTRNAVLCDAAHTFKKSMRSATMLPALALVDPELTVPCPPEVLAACGMDAITQLIEACTSSRGNPLTTALALQGLQHAAELPFLLADPADAEARTSVSYASLLGGMCLANAGLGAVHGLAAPLGAMFPVPHGVACAALLPEVLEHNVAACLRAGRTQTLDLYADISQILTGSSSEWNPDDDDEDDLGGIRDSGEPVEEGLIQKLVAELAQDLAVYLRGLRHSFKLPGLGKYGVRAADFERIIAESGGTSMQTNPVQLGPEELRAILAAAL